MAITGHSSSQVCQFCQRRAEIEITKFGMLATLGDPILVCRFCLGRPHRAQSIAEGAITLRLHDLDTQRTSTGRAAHVEALLKTLAEDTSYRSITSAVRLVNLPDHSTDLHCAACGRTVTPDGGGGVLVWTVDDKGIRHEPRVLHSSPCASGEALKPGCWEDLETLSRLDLDSFDVEAMGVITDVELAWKQLREG